MNFYKISFASNAQAYFWRQNSESISDTLPSKFQLYEDFKRYLKTSLKVLQKTYLDVDEARDAAGVDASHGQGVGALVLKNWWPS